MRKALLKWKGLEFNEIECTNVARTGNLNALKYARAMGSRLAASIYHYIVDFNDFGMLKWMITLDPQKGQVAS